MVIGDLFEELIEYSSLDSLGSLVTYLLGMLENQVDTSPLDSTREDHWSIREEVKPLGEIVHISLHDGLLVHTWLREYEIPLIDDDDDSFFCLESNTDDMLILMGHSINSINHDGNHIRSLDRSLCSHHAPLLDIGIADLA